LDGKISKSSWRGGRRRDDPGSAVKTAKLPDKTFSQWGEGGESLRKGTKKKSSFTASLKKKTVRPLLVLPTRGGKGDNQKKVDLGAERKGTGACNVQKR